MKKLLAGIGFVALIVVPLQAQMPNARQVAAIRAERPSLVVLLAIDCFRSDYLTRFKPQFTGGFKKLLANGAVFLNAFQDHGITETAPGHSAMLSGRFPVHTGIIMNSQGVKDSSVSLIDAPGAGASPFRFRGTTLVDWLVRKDPRTRVLSVSRKDRAAILPIGKSKQPIFWYAVNGKFTTSTYYGAHLPKWVEAFNARRMPATYASRDWNLLLPERAYREPDSVPYENGGRDIAFPHRAMTDPRTAVDTANIGHLPWMDEITLQFALAGVEALQLGTGHQMDVLSISLSTNDAVGHRFGPNSREVHDHVLRLDREIGAFLDSLFKLRDERRIVIALTSDHGLAPYPEETVADPAARRVDLNPQLASLRKNFRDAGIADDSAVRFDDGILTLSHIDMDRAHMNRGKVMTGFAEAVLRVRGVARADRLADLAARDTTGDILALRWRHMVSPVRDTLIDLIVSIQPNSYWWKSGVKHGEAQHGSPYDYDAIVPIIFYGRQFRKKHFSEKARVVDIAPTLARVAGVTPTEKIDGRTLTNAIR
jgi:predicted AlkP superfamily pyrophosphatase or phosphodiesterase